MAPPTNPFPYFPDTRQHYYPPNYSHLFYYNHPYGYYDVLAMQDNTRKRQRRQTAGAYIQNIFGGKNANSKKKSTAQPRPAIVVPPRGIGPVYDPNENDVLAGRGGRINAHKGNVQFRELVAENKQRYLAKSTKKLEKAHIAAEIVRYIRTLEPSGRFLKEDNDGAWWDIGDQKAIKKVGQALREDAPDIRGDIDPQREDGDDDDNKFEAESPAAASEPTPVSSKPASASARPGVTVSGRGAKIVSVPVGPANEQQQQAPTPSNGNYKTLAYQELSTPEAYEQVVPGARGIFNQAGGQRRGILQSNGPGVSGAAAAAMQQGREDTFEAPHPRGDHAFGRPFVHPPHHVDGHRETSLISGLSNPSMMSGVQSDISALTDPVSSISENYQRTRREQLAYQMRQRENLNQLRQQWANETNRHLPPTNSTTSIDMTATRQLGGSAGMGSSLIRSNSFSDTQVSADMAGLSVSTPDHSLAGGGIRDGSMLSGLSAGMQNSSSPPRVNRQSADTVRDVSGLVAQPVYARTFRPIAQPVQPYHQAAYQPVPPQQQPVPHSQPQTGSDNLSVASMSMNSTAESLNSIMTDLSDNLVALDLAENRLLDRLYDVDKQNTSKH